MREFAQVSSLFLFTTLALTACDRYRVTVNDNEVYTPPPVFSDYLIEDEALDRCVAQTLADLKARSALELTQLNCSSAGIYSLSGVEVFTSLERINLSGNPIKSLSPLARLPELKQVVLREVSSLSCVDIEALRAVGVTVETGGQCPET